MWREKKKGGGEEGFNREYERSWGRKRRRKKSGKEREGLGWDPNLNDVIQPLPWQPEECLFKPWRLTKCTRRGGASPTVPKPEEKPWGPKPECIACVQSNMKPSVAQPSNNLLRQVHDSSANMQLSEIWIQPQFMKDFTKVPHSGALRFLRLIVFPNLKDSHSQWGLLVSYKYFCSYQLWWVCENQRA